MTDEQNSNGRWGRIVQGVSVTSAIILCTLAVQATWNMAGGLASLKIETASKISDLDKAQALSFQELRMQVAEQGRQIQDIKNSLQKSAPQGR